LLNVGAGGGAPAAGAPAASSAAAAPEEEKKEEAKEEEKEESDDDMVRTLFFDFHRLQVLIFFFLFTLYRVSDFSINLLYFIRFPWKICYVACPM